MILLAIALSFSAYGRNSSTAASRSNGLIKFLVSYPGLRNMGLYSLLATRCTRYADFGEKATCRNAVEKEIQILDIDVIYTKSAGAQIGTPDGFVFVAFKKSFYELLSQPRTTLFLIDLEKKLNLYFQHQLTELNIWEVALSHYKTPLEASKALAILFQDTSIKKLHLAYLDMAGMKGNKYFDENKAHLTRSIDTINLILDYSESSYRELFYPKVIQETLNRNIYHFYVPLYLSLALMKNGVDRKSAFIAPFMLTLTYEFITAADDYRYLIWDPSHLDPRKHEWKMKDIYGGYSGTIFGTRNTKAPVSLEIMKQTFARSTEEAVSLLLRY